MCSSSDVDCTSLEYSAMVPRTLKPLCQGTNATAPQKRNSDNPQKYCPPIDDRELNHTTARLLSGKPLCVKENPFVSRRKGTLFNYEAAWRKWPTWCLEQKNDPFQAPVKGIIENLTFVFNYGNKYRTKNFHKSSISAFDEYIDGLPAEKHSWICSLVCGVFNLKPPKPRCMLVWDAEQVLDFLKEKFGDNSQLSNKELTLKVTILLALTISSRLWTVHILDLNHMIKASEYYEFRFYKLHKSWRRGESRIYIIRSGKALCVVADLDCYVKR